MKKPDFFIVGAPKCVTTALCDYLGQHPEIFIPKQKETHHFATDLIPPEDYRLSRENYLRIFKNARDERKVGEASVFYLYSKNAARNIYEFNNEAQIIAMVRNPVDVLYSYHSQLVYNGDEDITDFESALDAEEERKKGNLISTGLRFREGLYYSDVVRFNKQIKRYFGLFGREKVFIAVYDDIREDTVGVCRDIYEFLGVDPGFRPDFRIINKNKRVRSKALQKFASGISHPAFCSKRLMKIVFLGFVLGGIGKTIRWLNTKYEEREPTAPELRSRLRYRMAPEIELLGKTIGRDLSHWVKEKVV